MSEELSGGGTVAASLSVTNAKRAWVWCFTTPANFQALTNQRAAFHSLSQASGSDENKSSHSARR